MSGVVSLNGTSFHVINNPSCGVVDVMITDTDDDKSMSLSPVLAVKLAEMLAEASREISS